MNSNQQGIEDLKIYDLLGYASVLFNLIAFKSANKNEMRAFGAISTFLFGINIFYYGGLNGVVVIAVSFSSKIISFFIDGFEKCKIVKIIATAIVVIFYLYHEENTFYDFLPVIALFFIIIADFQSTILMMKKYYYGSAISWLIYGIYLNSIPAIVYDILGIIILSITIFKLRKNEYAIQK